MKITYKCCCGSEIIIEDSTNSVDLAVINRLDTFSETHKDHGNPSDMTLKTGGVGFGDFSIPKEKLNVLVQKCLYCGHPANGLIDLVNGNPICSECYIAPGYQNAKRAEA